MSTIEKQGLENEWLLLQSQFDGYEKYSLLIKLLSITLLCSFYLFSDVTLFTVTILLILWMQDAIWKTFQSRIEPRLLGLEQSIKNDIIDENSEPPYQFNSQYYQSRPSQFGLIKEYISQSLRPTIAFPHIVLFTLAVIALFG
ncbi:hypothetical protein L4D09_22820 [Photobacterium makurazakiensis]|uniref:hypothetical protein n=1 Tax=Photobacterium makurazakiensis TaxID=2910234 RepID=UPI003D0C2831